VEIIFTIWETFLLEEVIGREDFSTLGAVEMLRMPFFTLGCDHLVRLKITRGF